jgi:hypothetical protein
MSTVLSAPTPSRNTMPTRVKSPSITKHRPRAYTPWREPVSERQINAHFEQRILPELSVLLEAAFVDFSESDCEEAVQDAVCQALEAYRTLRLGETGHTVADNDKTPAALARFASGRYLAGVRFANSRSASRL